MTKKDFIRMLHDEMPKVKYYSSKYMFYDDFEESDPEKYELYRELYNYYLGQYVMVQKMLRMIEETEDNEEVENNENN